MSSYKKHALFSIMIALPFIQDVFYLSFAVIGASIIDMDHHVKKNDLMIMTISGIILFILLYILKLPYLIGISLIVIVLIFHLSRHRGFAHSLLGILVLSSLLTFFLLGLYSLFHGLNIESKISLIIISVISGIMILNKKILLPFFILVLIGVIITPNTNLSIYYTFLAILTGSLSHIMLDLFTPSGIELFNPLSSRKFKKYFGTVLVILWALSSFIFIFKFKYPVILW